MRLPIRIETSQRGECADLGEMSAVVLLHQRSEIATSNSADAFECAAAIAAVESRDRVGAQLGEFV